MRLCREVLIKGNSLYGKWFIILLMVSFRKTPISKLPCIG